MGGEEEKPWIERTELRGVEGDIRLAAHIAQDVGDAPEWFGAHPDQLIAPVIDHFAFPERFVARALDAAAKGETISKEEAWQLARPEPEHEEIPRSL